MVSLTFDEFHAIRSRQRAAAEAEAAAATAATTSISKSMSNPSSSNKPAGPKGSTKASVVANPDGNERDSRVSVSPPSTGSSSPDFRDGRNDEIAPTSGSVIRKPNQLQHQQQHQQDNKSQRKTIPTSGWGRGLGLGSTESLGRFVELYEVQVAVVAMIYLDLVASTAQLLPYLQAVEAGEGAGAGADEEMVDRATGASGGAGLGTFVIRFVTRLMQSFTGFTIIFFAMEVVMLLAAFRGKFFRHLGYVLDLCLVSVCLYQELAGKGKGMRLLGALRVWRVARVMNTLLLSADEAHDQTRETLRVTEKSTRDLDTDRRRLQESLRREVEARKRVDKMLRGYKDEVETLNEALKIAAMDIAVAGVSPDLSGLGGEEGELHKRGMSPADSDTGKSRTASSDGGGGQESVDGVDQNREKGQRQEASSAGSTTNKIFVFQDGTFQAR